MRVMYPTDHADYAAHAEFIRQGVVSCRTQSDRVAAMLASKGLADTQRGALVLAFRRLTRQQRKWLGVAESSGAIPPAEAVMFRSELAQKALVVCKAQEAILWARLDTLDLLVSERCAAIRTVCTVMDMILQLEKELGRAGGDGAATRWARN
jgi:hypothetical protein